MEDYSTMRKRQQDEFDKFPLGAAFSQKQFDEMMIKWGLKPTDVGEILNIGSGCFIRKSDRDAFHEILNRHSKEQQDAIAVDKTGDGFIYSMFYYELCNHEYGYTGIFDDTLEALGYTVDDINSNPALLHGLTKAARQIMNEEEE